MKLSWSEFCSSDELENLAENSAFSINAESQVLIIPAYRNVPFGFSCELAGYRLYGTRNFALIGFKGGFGATAR